MSNSHESVGPLSKESPAGRQKLHLLQPLRNLFEQRLPDGIGWAHIFGSTLLALIALQLLTGVLLSLNYSASTSTAWESVRYIQNRAVFGGLIRGVHHWAASASIVVAALHLVRVFLYAAYRKPRRWTWFTGVLLFLVLLGFGLTGYLLPWDLKAYFGTRVATEIPGSVPVIGPYILQLIRGGEDVSPFTLTRFYAVHVIVLPAVIAALVAIHLYLVRLHGITPPWCRVGEKANPGSPFFPYQAMKDSVAIFVAIVIVFGLALLIGAPLEPKADPTSSSYVPRPDWYFLGLQHLLRIFQGKWQILGTFVIPNLIIIVLLSLPWFDRNIERRIRARLIALSIGGTCVVVVVGMTIAGYNAVHQEEVRMEGLSPPASSMVETPTPITQSTADLGREGGRLYVALGCGSCHGPDRKEIMPGLPPDLSFVGSKLQRDWIRDYMQNPQPIRYKSDGVRPMLQMPDFRLSEEKALALAAYLSTQVDPVRFPPSPSGWSSTRQQVDEGKRLFNNYQCLGCHMLGSEGNRIGPDLSYTGLRLKPKYLEVFLEDPEAIIPGTSMKNFQLWEEERAALVAFLQSLK